MMHDVNVPQTMLIDLLWHGRPPRSAPSMLHRYVWRLRTALAIGTRRNGTHELIATDGECYRLVAEHAHLDVCDFQQVTMHARQIEAGDPLGACDLYDMALELWPDDSFTDIELLCEQPVARQFTAARTDMTLSYARLAIRMGQPERVLPPLHKLCARDPFNEVAHALLMAALAADGHRAAASQVYRDIRSRLHEELGVEPGPHVASTYAGIFVRPGAERGVDERGPAELAREGNRPSLRRPSRPESRRRLPETWGSARDPLRGVVIMGTWRQHP
jgi:DNA-binding SARP family transcriptional activator